MESWPGTPYPLGATFDGTGTNFAVFSEVAERVELCLLDDDGVETRLELTEVDLSAIANDVASVQRHSYAGMAVDLRIAPGLRALADEGLVRLVLDNLISNAFKYSSKQQQSLIELGAQGTTFFVRDNGAGFDQAQAAKLFMPFVRLHKESEFPGTGIGLATVHRIIERHGGRIWAEGEVGRGTTIFFTLPDARSTGTC